MYRIQNKDGKGWNGKAFVRGWGKIYSKKQYLIASFQMNQSRFINEDVKVFNVETGQEVPLYELMTAKELLSGTRWSYNSYWKDVQKENPHPHTIEMYEFHRRNHINNLLTLQRLGFPLEDLITKTLEEREPEIVRQMKEVQYEQQ